MSEQPVRVGGVGGDETIHETPPEQEGDDSEAGGGAPAVPPTENGLEDTRELDEDDYLYEDEDEPDS